MYWSRISNKNSIAHTTQLDKNLNFSQKENERKAQKELEFE